MTKLVIICHPTSRSTTDGMKRILREVLHLAASSGIYLTWKEELEEPV